MSEQTKQEGEETVLEPFLRAGDPEKPTPSPRTLES